MDWFLSRILGIEPPAVLEGWRLVLGSQWPALALVALAVPAVAAAVWLYWREPALSRTGRTVLGIARAMALSALLLAIFRPMVRADIRRPLVPTVLVLVDESASMDIRDARKDEAAIAEAALVAQTRPTTAAAPSRRELVQAALGQLARPALNELSAEAEVRYFRFATGIEEEEWEVESGKWKAFHFPPSTFHSSPATGNSSATHLGSAIDEAMQRSAGRPVALVVAITDGASKGGVDPMEAAMRLRGRGVRLMTIGVGLPHPDDVSLRNLVVPEVVFANDLVPLRVQCAASGYERRSTTLLVKIDGQEVARKTVTFGPEPHFEELPFKAPRAGGMHNLQAVLLELPGEAEPANNVLAAPLRVLDEKIKVLYIEGVPRWEYRYIRAVLKRDPRIDVQFITTEGDKDLARASREHLGRFPEKESSAFAYDLVILGDVRASTFTATQFSLLDALVRQRGGSLIVLAGPRHAPAEYLDTPLSAMLPVRFEQGPWEEIGDDVHPVLTPLGRASTVMSLVGGAGGVQDARHARDARDARGEERGDVGAARNQAIWANIKPMNWVPPVTGAKPGAQVLAELSDTSQRMRGYPLIAWHRYGAGKVMFVGTDQLWRLRVRTGDTHHLRFWGQAVQFLALSRLLGDNRRVQVASGRSSYALGEPVELFASAANDLYEPLSAATLVVSVTPIAEGSESEPVTLRAMVGKAGMYHGVYWPRSPGRWRVAVAAGAMGSPLTAGVGGPNPESSVSAPSDAQFTVSTETSEHLQTGMQRELLVRMAEVTGGKYLPLSELPKVREWARDARAARDARDPLPAAQAIRTTRQLDLWDNWLLVAVFVTLVALEWAWRRNSNLA